MFLTQFPIGKPYKGTNEKEPFLQHESVNKIINYSWTSLGYEPQSCYTQERFMLLRVTDATCGSIA